MCIVYNHLGICRQWASPYINKQTTEKTIQIPSSNNTIRRTIHQLKSTKKFKYLGVTSDPGGNQHHQFQVILQNTKIGSVIISSNFFTHHQVLLYFISYLLPKLTSPLTSAALDTHKYEQIEGVFHPCVIAAMEYNRTCPIALSYRTHQYGGLQMKNLEVEVLIKKMHCLKTLMHKEKHKS